MTPSKASTASARPAPARPRGRRARRLTLVPVRGLTAPRESHPIRGCGRAAQAPHPAGATASEGSIRWRSHSGCADRRGARRAPQARAKLTEQAVAQLRSSAGWQRWLTSRAHAGLRRLSLRNQLLVCLQDPTATHVAGFRAWLKLGYCVRRGATSHIRIWAPCPPRRRSCRPGATPAPTQPRSRRRTSASRPSSARRRSSRCRRRPSRRRCRGAGKNRVTSRHFADRRIVRGRGLRALCAAIHDAAWLIGRRSIWMSLSSTGRCSMTSGR